MDRLESAAWPLAGGVLCAFVLAVVCKDAGWQVGFAFVTAAVVVWSALASPPAGAVAGAAGWAFVTAFDVGKAGGLAVTGTGDGVRAAVLVGAGIAAGAAGRWAARAGRAARESRAVRDSRVGVTGSGARLPLPRPAGASDHGRTAGTAATASGRPPRGSTPRSRSRDRAAGP